MEDWVSRLARHIKAKGMTQQDLASRLEMTYAGVNHWFTRRRSPDTIAQFERIAKASECSASWLIFGVGPEEPMSAEDVYLARLIRRLPPGPKSATEALLRSLVNGGPRNGTSG